MCHDCLNMECKKCKDHKACPTCGYSTCVACWNEHTRRCGGGWRSIKIDAEVAETQVFKEGLAEKECEMDETDWQMDLMEEQGEDWAAPGPPTDDDPDSQAAEVSRIEDAAHALEEEERDSRARKERRPAWTGKPSSHGKQEQGKSIRKRILRERRKVASRYGD